LPDVADHSLLLGIDKIHQPAEGVFHFHPVGLVDQIQSAPAHDGHEHQSGNQYQLGTQFQIDKTHFILPLYMFELRDGSYRTVAIVGYCITPVLWLHRMRLADEAAGRYHNEVLAPRGAAE